jgi:hypothetical protein
LVFDHIKTCPRCALEVIEHQQVASLIGNSGGDAPQDLWSKIESQLPNLEKAERRSPPKLVLQPRDPLTSTHDGFQTIRANLQTPPARFEHKARRRLVMGVAATLVVIGLLSYQAIRLGNQVHQLQQAATPGQQLERAVASAQSNPSAQKVSLTASGSFGPQLDEIVILPNGESYLTQNKLPSLSEKQTYQLWGLVHGDLVSLGILGNHPSTVPFQLNPSVHVDEFAITVEAAGGVVRTTHNPISQSHFTTS